MKKLSIVIPTRNRQDVLSKALQAYLNQKTLEGLLEIIVVDDHSSDGTEAIVADFRQRSPIPIRYACAQHRGAAAARNEGIRQSKGELILFTDDDIIPSSDLIAEHISFHSRYPQRELAVLGYVAWSPEVRPTPFMRWLGEEGALFHFRGLKREQELAFDHFYTCNVSLKLEFLRANGLFDEEFEAAGWEDTELGYRLSKSGLRLLYNPSALAYHYRHLSFADAMRRARDFAGPQRIFETKEAGVRLWEITRRSIDSPGPRQEKLLVKILAPLLKPLLDTQVRLPSIVYAHLYQYYARKVSNDMAVPARVAKLDS